MKVQIKYPFRKSSYWIKGNKALETYKSKILENNPKTLTSPPLLLSPLLYETPIIESNEDTAGDTYHSLEVKVNLLSIEVIAMRSFIEYQMLILRESKIQLWKNPSVTATLKLLDQQRRLLSYATKIEAKVALYRHNLKITTHNKILPHLIRVTAKYQIDICETLKIWRELGDLVPFVQFNKCKNTHGGLLLLVKLRAFSRQLY